MAYQARKADEGQPTHQQTAANKNPAVNAFAARDPRAGLAIMAAEKLKNGNLGQSINISSPKMPNQQVVQQPGINTPPPTGDNNQSTTTNPKKDDNGNSSAGGAGLGGAFGSSGKNKNRDSSPWYDNSDNYGEQAEEPDFEWSIKMPKVAVKTLLVISLSSIIVSVFIFMIGTISGGTIEFSDAFGANYESGGDTGEVIYEPESKDAADFYKRISEVKADYQSQGKTIDSLKIAAVYHVLNSNNSKYDYTYMTTARIKEIASLMFIDNIYDETAFKENLTNKLFAKYFPIYTNSARKKLTEDVFDYIDRYYSFIGSNPSSTCASTGSCTYDVKGFYIPGGGNVSKTMQITNLMVRLMECGRPYGNGNYNTPINQPMVPFEEYVAGVAYAEIGPSAPIEALKAQMVAARSFALARPTGMGNSAGKKLAQENGQWVLQISSCVADQVFCNINEGCSFMGGGDGQGGICRSGKIPGAVRTRDALALDHQLRVAAALTEGEVLVNSQGYIIQAGYVAKDTNKFTSLAKAGLNYKQILLEVYNSSSRPYGATSIQKMSCNTSGTSSCINSAASGPYASWKQYSGPWTSIKIGTGNKTIKQIGCLATSVSILIAKSGVPTKVPNFNPGTFVQYLNSHGGFSGSLFVWEAVRSFAPAFQSPSKHVVEYYSKDAKLRQLQQLLNEGCYVVAEVKGNTGEHWVAIDRIEGSNIIMMDPGSNSNNMWERYNWRNTSQYRCYKVKR